MVDLRELTEQAARLVEHAGSAATPGPWSRNRPPGHSFITAPVPDGELDAVRSGRVTVAKAPTWEGDNTWVRQRSQLDLDWVALMDPSLAGVLVGVLRDAVLLPTMPGAVAALAARLLGSASPALLMAAGVEFDESGEANTLARY